MMRPASMPAAAPATPVTDRLAEQARRLLRDGRAEEALPMLDRLRHLGAPAAAALRAEAMLQLHRLEDAEAAADAALLEAEDASLRRLRARIRLARGRHAGAVDDAAAAVMAAPGDRPARLLLGSALLETGRHDEAIWYLGEAWRAEPGNHALQLHLGQAFLRAGRYEAASELFLHCETAAPWMAGVSALRAQAALLAGDAEAAAGLARAALARGVVDGAVHSVLAHALVSLGRLEEAGPHFAAAARLAPDNPYIAHLAAAAAGTATDRAPAGYVATLFDGYAAHFEQSLLGLGYRVPGLIRRAVERLRPRSMDEGLGPVLDLGCGTGLVGAALSDLLRGPLVGIDLSRRMLEQAATKGIYTELRQADLTEALPAEEGGYALITAADVFCYFGLLQEPLTLCRQRLAPGGLLLFSLEQAAPGETWRLGPEGRYRHAAEHVTACAAACGLEVLECRPEALRRNGESSAPGLLVAARAAKLRAARH